MMGFVLAPQGVNIRYIHRQLFQRMSVLTMSMGAYDEAEHERREEKTNNVEVADDDTRTTYDGSVEFDSGDSTEELLDQFEQMKSD
jgi:hypothetical protein